MYLILTLCVTQACFFTDFAAIQDNGISLILSLEKKSLSLGENSLSLGGKSLSFRKSTWVLRKNTLVLGEKTPIYETY